MELSTNDRESVGNSCQDTNHHEDQQQMTFILLNEIYSPEIYSYLFLSAHSPNSEILSNITDNIPIDEDNQAVETEENNVSELEFDFENDYVSDNATIVSQDEENYQDIDYLLNSCGDNNLEEFDFD